MRKGKKQHPLYSKWIYIQNCVNYINNRDGANAKKLQLDSDWNTFSSFREDIEATLGLPRANQQLVRKDMTKGWHLNNLHYTTQLRKSRLQRTCSYVKYKGRKVCAKELSEIAGINYHTMLTRMRKTNKLSELIKPTGKTKGRKNAKR